MNHGNYKNRLGAYHAPMKTFLDFTFLRTLPEAQIRNGFAELIKISSCAEKMTFDLLDEHCEDLIRTGFGRKDGASKKVHVVADMINKTGIHKMLDLETPNLHEIGLDRIIAYGHTWSPLHELVPNPPLRHGHAISIDMAYSATLANLRGLLSDSEHRRLLNLFSKAGLSMDHPQFDEDILDRGTKAILKTRDGLLRAAVPSPLGSCVFLNDVSAQEMFAALKKHKEIMQEYPRNGEGIEAFVDASDTGYTMNGESTELTNGHTEGLEKVQVLNDDTKITNGTNGVFTNGHKEQNDSRKTTKVSSVTNGVNGVNGANGETNGVHTKPYVNGVKA